jgi:hypothetical protein
MTDDSNKRIIKIIIIIIIIIITRIIFIRLHCKISRPLFRKYEHGTKWTYLD